MGSPDFEGFGFGSGRILVDSWTPELESTNPCFVGLPPDVCKHNLLYVLVLSEIFGDVTNRTEGNQQHNSSAPPDPV